MSVVRMLLIAVFLDTDYGIKGGRDLWTNESPQRVQWASSPILPPATTHRVSLVSVGMIILPASAAYLVYRQKAGLP
jgi:hypothetical protein